MVSPELIYIKFLNKVNKGNTRGDTAVDKERFVLIFNVVKTGGLKDSSKQRIPSL